MTLKWHGREASNKLYVAVANGINKTMGNAVLYAVNNHTGWKYRTGVAERSIGIKSFSRPTNKGATDGIWGSLWPKMPKVRKDPNTGIVKVITTNYVYYLDKYHGGFLRNAQKVNKKDLIKNIKKFYG